MKMDRKSVRIVHSSEQEKNKVVNMSRSEALSFVWDLTQEIYSLTGDFDAKSRLQRHVVCITKKQC